MWSQNWLPPCNNSPLSKSIPQSCGKREWWPFCLVRWIFLGVSTAGSQHTRSYPWQGHEEENLTGKVDRVFRDFKKAGSWDPTHDKVMRRKPDRQGISGFQGFQKAAPSAHLKDDICLFDACFNRLLPNFCDTGRRPSLISFQIRINLEL